MARNYRPGTSWPAFTVTANKPQCLSPAEWLLFRAK